jgi:hypothetical protein
MHHKNVYSVPDEPGEHLTEDQAENHSIPGHGAAQCYLVWILFVP